MPILREAIISFSRRNDVVCKVSENKHEVFILHFHIYQVVLFVTCMPMRCFEWPLGGVVGRELENNFNGLRFFERNMTAQFFSAKYWNVSTKVAKTRRKSKLILLENRKKVTLFLTNSTACSTSFVYMPKIYFQGRAPLYLGKHTMPSTRALSRVNVSKKQKRHGIYPCLKL